MAVLIPVLLTATGASAAIGAAVGLGAAMVTTIATVAFAVTGISDKINKAAEGVFGKDLTMIGNIFGAAYGAFGGGFAGAAEAATGAEGLNAVNGADLASDLFTKAGTSGAGDFGSLADLSGEAQSMNAINGADAASDAYTAASQSRGMESMAPSQTLSPQVSGGKDLLNGDSGVPKMAATDQFKSVTEAAPVQPTTTAAQGAAAQNASAPVASAQQTNAAATNAAGSNAAAPVQGQSPASVIDNRSGSDILRQFDNTKAGGRSFFDKLVFDDKGNVSKTAFGLLEGAGKGISSASAASTLAKQKREQEERALAEQQRRTNQRTGMRVTG